MSAGDYHDILDWNIPQNENDRHSIGNDEIYEGSYDDEEFEPDEDEEVKIEEMGDCVEYRTSIGPSIKITNTKSKGKVVNTAISILPNRDVGAHGGNLLSAISSIVSNRNRGEYHAAAASPSKKLVPGTVTRMKTLPKRTGNEHLQQKLCQSINKLKLGNTPRGNENVVAQTCCKTSIRYRKATAVSRKPSLLSLGKPYPTFCPQGLVGKRVDSAKRLQIKDLMNKVHDLETSVEDLKLENKTLKTVHFRQDKALKKYEGDDADFSKMLTRHKNEIRYLQATVRKASTKSRDLEQANLVLNQKTFKLEQENKRLLGLVEDGDLEERYALNEQLKLSNQQNKKNEEKLDEYKRHIEFLEKNHLHQISVENAKLKHSSKTLADVQELVDQMSDLLKQKDTVINYFKMRSSRNQDLDPPMLKKMMATQNEIMKKKASLGRTTPPAARSPERERPCKHRQGVRGPYTEHRSAPLLKTRENLVKCTSSERDSEAEVYSDDFDDGSDFAGSGDAEGSGTLSIKNPVSQNQDFSDETDGEQYMTGSDEPDLFFDEEPKELNKNNLEEYYKFDPSIKEEDSSYYSPRKSIFLEALGTTSCSGSSNSSPMNATPRNNQITFGQGPGTATGCGDRQSSQLIAVNINSVLPVSIESSSGSFRPQPSYPDRPVSSVLSPRAAAPLKDESKEASNTDIGPAGDTCGNLQESTSVDKEPSPHPSPRKVRPPTPPSRPRTANAESPLVIPLILTPRKITTEVETESKVTEHVQEVIAETSPRKLTDEIEPGFISQREVNPGPDKVIRLAELREIEARAQSQRPIEISEEKTPEASSGSESQEDAEDTGADEDEDGDEELEEDEHMKMYFKVSKPIERNLNETQSFQDIRRVNKMLGQLGIKDQEDEESVTTSIPMCPLPPLPEFELKPLLYTPPNIRTANMVPRMNQFSRSTKEPPPIAAVTAKLELPSVVKPFSSLVVEGARKSTNVFDSPMFCSVNNPIPVQKKQLQSGFFANSPSPPPSARTHYNFDAVSIFSKSEKKSGTTSSILGGRRSDENLLMSKIRTQPPSNTFQHSPRPKPNPSHSENQPKVATRKPSNIWK